MIQKILKTTLVLVVLIAATACVSVLPKTAPPAPRYTISSVLTAPIPSTPVGWSLAIADPTSSQLFNSVKVPVMASNNRFEFLAGAEWADLAPVLFQRALVRSFENTEKIINVGDFTAVPVSDYTLKTDIRSFHADLSGNTPIVTIEIFARLIDDNGNIIVSKPFKAQEPALSPDAAILLSAFGSGLDRVLNDIIIWSFAEIERDQQPV